MTSLNTQLQALSEGKTRKIRGKSVRREGDTFYVDDEPHSMEEAAAAIGNKKRQKFPYDSVAFLLVKPPSRVVSSHQIKSRKEHADLIEKAKQKKYIVYYADVKKVDGKYMAVQPWVVDFESVDNLYGPVENLGKPTAKPAKPKKERTPNHSQIFTSDEKDEEDIVDRLEEMEDTEGIFCPFCEKKMNSTPGRTLHVKSKHPDRYEEYLKNK
jgi:hypothetical protein